MIRKWFLKGFKSIYDFTEFNIAPLTIFTGANSSGKSSVIQSILLTTQTLQNNIHSKPIILNGQIIRLGTFEDILSYKLKENEINIGFELENSSEEMNKQQHFFSIEEENNTEKKMLKCSFSFTADTSAESTSLQPFITESKLKVYNLKKEIDYNYISIRKSGLTPKEKASRFNITTSKLHNWLDYDVIDVKPPKRFNYNSFRFNNLQKVEELYIGAELIHFIPERVISRINKNEFNAVGLIEYLIYPEFEIMTSDMEILINDPFKEKVFKYLDQILKSIEENSPKIQLGRIKRTHERLIRNFDSTNYERFQRSLPQKSKKELALMLEKNKLDLIKILYEDIEPVYLLSRSQDQITDYTQQIIQYFNNKLKYLGPLRDEPKPIYPNATSLDSKDVGYKGEFTAAVLELHKETIIEYISPDDLEEDYYERKSGKLIDAVLEWLNYMGISSDVKTLDRGKLGHELQVKLGENGKFNDLTNVGVGVSQVLPILVLCLLADKDSTIIFEQPELHLHPRVQSRLGDFFVTMIELEKQCIVETHSEYIINRLRYKAVSSEKDNISDNAIIYFVEQENGKSQYKPIQINEYGVIEQWPKGFFDEHEDLSTQILKAARNKSKGL